MKVLFTGGGTAGHINPAIAIAELFRKNEKDLQIAFAGTKNGLERELTRSLDCPYYEIESRGFKRKLSFKNLYALASALFSPIAARKIIRDFSPDLVVGTGGYVCWPILVAAAREGVPTALHESNAYPGLAVRKLERYTDRILLNFKESAVHFKHPEKTLHTGIPLRSDFGKISYPEARRRLGIERDVFYIVSFGGSLGARSLNRAVVEWMAKYGKEKKRLFHLHGAGSYQDNFIKCYFDYSASVKDQERLRVTKYIEDMHLQMAAADLLICRAGAVTLSELAALSKPSVLIPSENVTDNHQEKNARLFADAGASTLLLEKDLSADALEAAILPYYNDKKLCRKAGLAAHGFKVADTDTLILNSLRSLVRDR